MRIVGVVVVVAALAGEAHASWSFSWVCAGACAPDRLDIRGVETGYSDESSCEAAARRKALELNSDGSAGSTSDCTDGDPPSTDGAASRPVRAARLARAYFAIDAGQGYEAHYMDGRVERGSSQIGGELELMFGRDQIGIGLELGYRRDAGTAPSAGAAIEPMTLVDIGFGLASSPLAIVHTSAVEIRPDLGAYYVWAVRTGCGARCDEDPLNPQIDQPDQGNTFRLRAGLDFYFGAWKNQGVALDALVQLGQLGDLDAGGAEQTALELHPPQLLFRLSYVRRPRK